jgi:hypothetical protein
LHQQVVIKTEKDLMRLKAILSMNNPISDYSVGNKVKIGTAKEFFEIISRKD